MAARGSGDYVDVGRIPAQERKRIWVLVLD